MLDRSEAEIKGIYDRLGTWSGMVWVVLKVTRQIGHGWRTLILWMIAPRCRNRLEILLFKEHSESLTRLRKP